MKYRAKPVVKDAVKWTGYNVEEVADFTGKRAQWNGNGFLEIETPEGVMRASIGDYIIKGLRNEFYPCKPDIFEESYEPLIVKEIDEKEAKLRPN